MHSYSKFFPVRHRDDQLDVVPLLFAGLTGERSREVLSFNGSSVSTTVLSSRVALAQQWLRAHGINRGDRVALMLENNLPHICLIYALVLSGVVWVPVNTRLKSAGLAYLLNHCQPRLFIYAQAFEDVLKAVAASDELPLGCVSISAIALEDMLTNTKGSSVGVPDVAASTPADTLCIIYTSGTTGAPKGVRFTHRMMRVASEAALQVAKADEGDCLFVWEPLCHIGGAQMLLAPFIRSVRLAIVERFSASNIWSQIASSGATHIHYLGGILDILMQNPQGRPQNTDSLRIAWGAGVSKLAWPEICSHLRLSLHECYGMTECSSFATVNENGVPGSMGQPLPWITLQLLDDDGQGVSVGEPGQVVLSSDVEGVFLDEYISNPEASAQVVRQGRLYTGDMATCDANGNLYFVGRKSDSMRVRGENVSAWEIERVFALHPAVAASAAIGVQGTIGEQEVLLYLQFKEEMAVSFAALYEWAQSRLPSFQLPKYYSAVEAFDMTPSQRIRKHLLSRDIENAWSCAKA